MKPNVAKEAISQKLREIEANYGVDIIFAVESGSRAWGFESKDSDYDVRFVYVHNVKHYLSLHKKRDVIEDNFGILDFAGWDIRKALSLLAVQNVQLWEWANSPVVYKDGEQFKQIIRNEFRTLNVSKVLQHYRGIAKNARDVFVKTGNAKKFLYMARAAACMNYIVSERQMPPVRFEDLLDAVFHSNSQYPKKMKEDFNELVKWKKTATEKDKAPNVDSLLDWVSFNCSLTANEEERPFTDYDNVVFQYILGDSNGS